MAAALVLPISGPYVGVWGSFPMGVLNDDGYQLSVSIQGQEINETDQWGMTLVEAIHRGQNWRCRILGLEWNRTGLLSILQMFGQIGAAGTFNPILDESTIGDRWTSYCDTLVLTSILGFPPATPFTITAVNAGFAPNSNTAFDLTSKVREMPMELVLFPYTTTINSVVYHLPFTTT